MRKNLRLLVLAVTAAPGVLHAQSVAAARLPWPVGPLAGSDSGISAGRAVGVLGVGAGAMVFSAFLHQRSGAPGRSTAAAHNALTPRPPLPAPTPTYTAYAALPPGGMAADFTTVPEPPTPSMLAAGLAVIAAAQRRRPRRRSRRR